MRTTVFRPERVTIVAVLNATPDSFSDGGRFVQGDRAVNVAAVVDAAARLVEAGAHVLDIGGESTRPGSSRVPVAEEIARTSPAVEALAKRFDLPISIDTRKAPVAEVALDAGADIVNDISGLRHDPTLAELAGRRHATLILGHLRGSPGGMQDEVHFDDVLGEVAAELAASVALARDAGVADEQLCVDPGIGFGKHLEHNLALLARVGELRQRLELPVLVGPSRKAFLGALTGEPVERRDEATAAACAVAVFAGADAVRVHDVAGAARAVAIGRALRDAAAEGTA
ncbi:MAG: dihydropteroate synthase [Deltaproteobacteria bacterium]|nr:dihydropteroate synthase [Deltaproteobacteria bacterium]MBW2360401.1 dihydropteroate synthase [Deltaproteobacteria bacterium]